jgi:hypothetical protein
MRGNPHVRFGGRAGETDQPKGRHRASVRSNHWMATEGLGGGADIETVAGRGGWASTTTPLEVYSHFRPARDAELARRLAERLDGEG